MKVDLFDFDLPEDRIALHPVSPRDSAKMLVVAEDGGLADHVVTDLEMILRAGDVLVVNDTRVIPADLRGTRHRGEFAASVSFNLHKRVTAARGWRLPGPQSDSRSAIAWCSEPHRKSACSMNLRLPSKRLKTGR